MFSRCSGSLPTSEKSAKSIRPSGFYKDALSKQAKRNQPIAISELAETAYLQLEKLPTAALLKLAKMGDKTLRLLGMTKR